MTLEEIEKRLKILEDMEEIRNLQYHYVNCLTKTEWDELMDCFSENAVLDVGKHGPRKGRAEIEPMFRDVFSKGHVGKEGNFVVHPIITLVEEDKAKGSWLIYIMHLDAAQEKALDWVQGYYDMEYVRENGKWKISYLGWQRRLGPPPPN